MQKIKLFKFYTEKDKKYWADLSLLGQEPTFNVFKMYAYTFGRATLQFHFCFPSQW